MLFLDIETTGLKPEKHQILSLGMLYIDEKGNEHEFLENCKFEEYVVTPEALNINGINLATHEGLSIKEFEASAISFIHDVVNKLTLEEFVQASKNPLPISLTIDNSALNNYIKNKAKKNKLSPIGFNVGSFDMMFIKKYLPNFSEYFSYRAVDVNSLIYLEADINGIPFDKLKKYYFKKFEMNHNALDDCKQTYEVYKEVKESLLHHYDRSKI